MIQAELHMPRIGGVSIVRFDDAITIRACDFASMDAALDRLDALTAEGWTLIGSDMVTATLRPPGAK